MSFRGYYSERHKLGHKETVKTSLGWVTAKPNQARVGLKHCLIVY